MRKDRPLLKYNHNYRYVELKYSECDGFPRQCVYFRDVETEAQRVTVQADTAPSW